MKNFNTSSKPNPMKDLQKMSFFHRMTGKKFSFFLMILFVTVFSSFSQQFIQTTRLELTKLSYQEIKDKYGEKQFVVKDLVNATPSQLKSRQPELFYITESDFNTYSFDRKIHIIKNPKQYIVVSNVSEIPKIYISRDEFMSLPAEKREAMMRSGDFIIK